MTTTNYNTLGINANNYINYLTRQFEVSNIVLNKAISSIRYVYLPCCWCCCCCCFVVLCCVVLLLLLMLLLLSIRDDVDDHGSVLCCPCPAEATTTESVYMYMYIYIWLTVATNTSTSTSSNAYIKQQHVVAP